MEELQLELELAITTSLTRQIHDSRAMKKRNFDEAFSDTRKRTLPLLRWDYNKQHCSGDLEKETHSQKSSITRRYADVEEDAVVGWPPVKSWVRKHREQSRSEGTAANYTTAESGGGGGSTSMFVKVEMEGVGIARKVDLSIHHSYHSLAGTLVAMFGKCQENYKVYKLTYQDPEGDWLLAGDVPWGDFIGSVRRLKLLRSEFLMTRVLCI